VRLCVSVCDIYKSVTCSRVELVVVVVVVGGGGICDKRTIV
jgi:hypothetical protein